MSKKVIKEKKREREREREWERERVCRGEREGDIANTMQEKVLWVQGCEVLKK